MNRESIEIVGFDAALLAIDGLVGRAREAAAAALYEEGEIEMTMSKRLVPVDYGTLRSTGHVEPPAWNGDTVTVGLGYGGPAGAGFAARGPVGYAVYVHENLDVHHDVGQAKYLEQPMREEIASGRSLRRMGDSIQRRLPI